jgi:hypothetical protein
VRLESPHFNVVRTGPNTYSFSDLIKYLTIPPLSLSDVRVTGGTIDFLDQDIPRVERHKVRDAELVVPFLTTIPHLANEYGNLCFSAVIDGAPLVIEAQVRGLPKAVEATAQVNLKNLSLPAYLSNLSARIPVQVESGKASVQGTASYRVTADAGPELGWDGIVAITEVKTSDQQGLLRADVGEVAVRSRLTLGEKTGMLLEDGAVEVRNFSVPLGERDGMTLGLLSIRGVTFAGTENRMGVAGVLLDKGRIRLSRDRKGIFPLMALFNDVERLLPRAKHAFGVPVRWRVGKIEGKGIDAEFTDGTRKGLPGFAVSGMSFVAEDVTGPVAVPMAFSFSARSGKDRDTAIQASGTFVPTPLSADVEVELRGLALAVGGPYLPAGLDVVIADGSLDLRLAVAMATRQDRLSGTYGGAASIRSLRLLDHRRGKLLAWEKLAIDGVKGTLVPMTLQVGKVGLSGMRAEVVMEKDGTLNLPKMPDAAGRLSPAKSQGGKGLEAIRVDEVVVKDGALRFTDHSVPGEFRASVSDLDARVTGLSSEPGKVADIRVQAVLQKRTRLRIAGKAAPLRKRAFADLDASLDRLDLATATPYSGAYLGIEIDRGTLTVKSRARIDQGKLAAENRIWVDRLAFGKPVKSDKATILPVRQLVDILRDKNGDIVLDIPLSASTDDKNLMGSIALQVAKDVVFPPGSPLQSVAFAECSTDLSPDAQGRLRKLADALQETPALKIDAIGYVDREVDGKACPERVAAGKGAAPTLDGDARMKQLAEGRATAVRDFLVGQGRTDPARVFARTRDIYGAPWQKDDRQARVEFAATGN